MSSRPIIRSWQAMGGSLAVDDEIAEADRCRISAFVSSRCVSGFQNYCVYPAKQIAIEDAKQIGRLAMSIVSFNKVS